MHDTLTAHPRWPEPVAYVRKFAVVWIKASLFLSLGACQCVDHDSKNTSIHTIDQQNMHVQSRSGFGECDNAVHIRISASRMPLLFARSMYTEALNTGLCAPLTHSSGARSCKIHIMSRSHQTLLFPFCTTRRISCHQACNSVSASKSASVL